MLIENISAGLFFISFILGLRFLLKSKTSRKEIATVSAISLLGFLDELSFGERHLDIEMHKIYDVKIDSAHDFVSLAYKMAVERPEIYSRSMVLFVLSCIAIISFFIFILLKYRSKLSQVIVKNYRKPPFIFLFLFTMLVFFSLVIDLEVTDDNPLAVVEEMCEMHAALALLFLCLSLRERVPKLDQLYR